MTINQLKYFEAICRCGGVTAAANELHISQPSVSASLRELEEEFGINLFTRMGKKLFLTKEGEYFLARCTPILEDCGRLNTTMKNMSTGKNSIQIGVPPMIGTSIYPELYREFSADYPDVHADIWEQSSRASCKMVELDSLDIAVTILNEVDRQVFDLLKLRDTEICFCVKNDSPLAKLKTISPSEISTQPLAMFKEGTYHVDAVLEAFKSVAVQPNIIVTSGQLQTIMQFVKQGLAATFLFKELVKNEPDLVAIPLSPSISVEIGLVWKKDRHMNTDTAKFIKSAASLVKQSSL